MPETSVLRIARPTDRLEALKRMYIDGLGLTILAEFENHDGFDGVILGYPEADYHIEFTSAHDAPAGGAPSAEHLLVFYCEDEPQWQRRCDRMISAGFVEVGTSNPYWEIHGKTFTDVDGYRVVVCKTLWGK